MANRQAWTSGLLLRLDYPQGEHNEIGVLTWIRAEWGGAAPPLAHYNPLNTILSYHGSTPYNSIGVQNYQSYEDGIEATALTLGEDHHNYEPIRNCLASGTPDLIAFIAAISASDWGSHPTLDYLTYVTNHLESERLLLVGSSQPREEENMILCPTKPTLANGRQPYAWLDVTNKRVILYNGASLVGDVPSGAVRVWTVPSSAMVQAMTTTRDNTTRLPDKRGVVVGAVDGGTFQALWA
jgi:hypothetical protein